MRNEVKKNVYSQNTRINPCRMIKIQYAFKLIMSELMCDKLVSLTKTKPIILTVYFLDA